MSETEIVLALRCTATVQMERPCADCKYHNALGCDSDRINFDAADLIEQLLAGKEGDPA